jgi:ankyrin repeat protein
MASQEGHVKTVAMLLAAQADVHTENANGTSALAIAARCGRTSIMKLLLSAGARAGADEEEDAFGLTAIGHAHEGRKKLERQDSCDLAITLLVQADC